MAGVVIKLLGAPELQRKLNALPDALEKKIVRKAMREAIRPVLASAKANAPLKTGKLKMDLRIRARKFKTRSKFGVQVTTAGGPDTPYAAANELGTKRQPARPFMRPALHGNREQIIATMKELIGKGIEQAARK